MDGLDGLFTVKVKQKYQKMTCLGSNEGETRDCPGCLEFPVACLIVVNCNDFSAWPSLESLGASDKGERTRFESLPLSIDYPTSVSDEICR